MLDAFINMWRMKELRTKLLFTMGMLVIYRIGFFIPLPAVDPAQFEKFAESQEGSAAGRLMDFVSIFTGGSFSQSTIFGLGVMPYISAAIIFQLLRTVVPSLQQLQKEGPAGQQKFQEYIRYAAVVLCLIQAMFYMTFLHKSNLIYAEYQTNPLIFWLPGLLGLTAGTMFLMWLGEQIDKYGIGNGISLIITAGIVSGMPGAVRYVYANFSFSGVDATKTFGPSHVLFLLGAFVIVVGGAIVITQGQRRIPIQQAKHTRGRRVYGGQKSYLPLRVNHGGVMPIIFASSLMMFPSMIFGGLKGGFAGVGVWEFLDRNFADFSGYLYILSYIGLIYFFAYFWTTVQFQPKEIATQLRDNGSFIPGLRPGPRTADYLETVLERITYVGAGFLAIIAVIASIVSGRFNIPPNVSTFLGGTGLLIVVSVMLDFVQRIEASLLMRDYKGFLGGGGGGGGPRIRGGRTR